MAQATFERVEKKYLLNEVQYRKLRRMLTPYLTADPYPEYTITNIYFDTDNFQLIRTSLDKPMYKEKLRLRAYGVPKQDTEVFLELKKKYDGIVYKRRVTLPLSEAERYLYEDDRKADVKSDLSQAEEADLSHTDDILDHGYKAIRETKNTSDSGRLPSGVNAQIMAEIDYCKRFYDLKPKAYIAYDRKAFQGIEDPNLRITFDENIRGRNERLHLGDGDDGDRVLPEGQILMEVKIPGVMQLFLAKALSELQVTPVSFSKYGMYYQKTFLETTAREAEQKVLQQQRDLSCEPDQAEKRYA